MVPIQKNRLAWMKEQENNEELFEKWKLQFPSFVKQTFWNDRLKTFGPSNLPQKRRNTKKLRIEWMKQQQDDDKLLDNWKKEFPKTNNTLFYRDIEEVFGVFRSPKASIFKKHALTQEKLEKIDLDAEYNFEPKFYGTKKRQCTNRKCKRTFITEIDKNGCSYDTRCPACKKKERARENGIVLKHQD